MAQITLNVPDDMAEALDRLAGAQYTTRATIIRQLLAVQIERERATAKAVRRHNRRMSAEKKGGRP